jgi:hypothetical protein
MYILFKFLLNLIVTFHDDKQMTSMIIFNDYNEAFV